MVGLNGGNLRDKITIESRDCGLNLEVGSIGYGAKSRRGNGWVKSFDCRANSRGIDLGNISNVGSKGSET